MLEIKPVKPNTTESWPIFKGLLKKIYQPDHLMPEEEELALTAFTR